MSLVPPPVDLAEGRQGHYAGAVSRLVAFGLDVGISWGLFTLGVGAFSLAWNLVTGRQIVLGHYQVASIVLLVAWEFIYFAYQWALGGKTIGMALLGIQVVQQDGSAMRPKNAVVRTLAFPLSIIILGLGFLGILTGRERRALHDRIAGTSVVYAWDARAARLRWLARKDVTVPATDPS